jgi:hypothetical protein
LKGRGGNVEEKISGGYSQEIIGLVLGEYKIYHQLGDLNRKVVIK